MDSHEKIVSMKVGRISVSLSIHETNIADFDMSDVQLEILAKFLQGQATPDEAMVARTLVQTSAIAKGRPCGCGK